MERYFPSKPTIQKMSGSEVKLRRMLAFAYTGAALYIDGGELQDNREEPFIDFLRDDPDEIRHKMDQRLRKALAASTTTLRKLQER